MHLDKDILIKGNKIYSPNTCIFVPQKINSLFTKRNSVRGEYPIGVTYSKKNHKFEPQVQGCGWLGYYDTPEESFEVYKKKYDYKVEITD